MSGSSTRSGGSSKRSLRSGDVEQPKRPCNAFCYFIQAQRQTMVGSFSPDRMKELWAQFRNMDARERAPYETKAAGDLDRYRREKQQYESSRLKKPCNAYMLFMKDYMKNKAHDFATARDVASAGAAVWKNMSVVQKAPWKRQAEDASKRYKMEKSLQESHTVHYSLTSAGLAAAAKLKKKAIATTASVKVKAKAPLKSAMKKATPKTGSKVLKKVTIKKRPTTVKRVQTRKSR